MGHASPTALWLGPFVVVQGVADAVLGAQADEEGAEFLSVSFVVVETRLEFVLAVLG